MEGGSGGLKVVKELQSPGIFAVELFIDKEGEVYVNETAPRVHNSGHHTIEANYSSQFDMLWRIILKYPLGNTVPYFTRRHSEFIRATINTVATQYTKGWMKCCAWTMFSCIYMVKRQTKPGQ